MVETLYVPDRGHVVWLAFSPQAGHEQAGHRPALVLSPQDYNEKTGMALFCPITSRVKGYPFEVPLPPEGSVTGVVLADQIRSLDWQARRARFTTVAPPQVVSEVREKLTLLLD
ncbi:MAG: endoribonuclease MazF [Rhodospirillales bacterium]|nr:endoribonuclease MazF [Rhodospirillales bacterium]